jgi:isochorismate synthase
MTDLFTKVNIHHKQQLPYVLYCKPNSERIVGLFQNDDHLYFLEDFEAEGFVMAPFDGEEIVFIPQSKADVVVELKVDSDFYFKSRVQETDDLQEQTDFETLVKNAVKAIENGIFQKVVLSRKEVIQFTDFDAEIIFKKLIVAYPTAFVYCFFHPKVGFWMGATPEQFLKIEEQNLQTVALAGTQLGEDSNAIVWPTKEREEQQIVTDYIISNLQDLATEITVSSPYTLHAGILNHIKTDISATITSENLKEIIQRLHPTPAVCGFPKAIAKQFILANENYDREFYAGFIGEWNLDLATFRTQQSDLFVNLRCMKIVKSTAELFIGCGITKDSNPTDEYIETVNKSTTMKKVLDF